jgi:ribosomal protein S1
MIVDVFGIEAFLPGSQIDVKPIRDYDVCKQTKQWIQSCENQPN